VRGCMRNTMRLIDGMEAYGISRVITPDVNVATFSPVKVPPPWRISVTRRGHLRIVCMPHVHADIIEKFLKDIGETYA
jgi:tyrosine decarboxylase/aspartate 1-decarboxylase